MLRSTTLFAAMLTAASVSAQQPDGSAEPVSPQRPAATQNVPRNEVPDQNHPAPHRNVHRHSTDRFDAQVADRLILGNQEEVALLKFGAERTKNKDVKDLAQSMIKDHEKAISDLRQFASPEHANIELTADQPERRDVVIRETRKVPAGTEDTQVGHDDILARMHRMARRVHEQCLIANREELTKYEDHEFDQAFLGQQLAGHVGMLAKLKAAQEDTSADLSDLTAKMQETTKKHKEHLEKLMNDLAKEAHSKK